MRSRPPTITVILTISIVLNVVLATGIINRTSSALPPPTITERPALSSSPSPDFPPTARVARVVDGDTVELESGERVRYLGVDAPETTGNPNVTQAEPLAQEATRFNRALVEGQRVWLLPDTTDRDRYGRLLRWVFLPDGTFVQAELVRQGYAFVNIIAPDDRFAELLRDLEARAKAERRGVWARSAAPLPTATPLALPPPATPEQPRGGREACRPDLVEGAIGPEATHNAVGQTATVVFFVVRTYNSGRAVFLNSNDPYQGYFYVVIFPERWNDFPEPPETYLVNRCVAITGRIQLYRGTPQIILRDVAQLRVLW
ncbi:MAG: thermonuclease family protein [Ardenticatenia bacterium]|nr:thermonuclease family protein [Ardenticatenia bacterium]